jgi:hypothetical protein
MAILKILRHIGIVMVISIFWMFSVGFFWELLGNKNYSLMAVCWIIGSIIWGWLYLRRAEKKEGLS